MNEEDLIQQAIVSAFYMTSYKNIAITGKKRSNICPTCPTLNVEHSSLLPFISMVFYFCSLIASNINSILDINAQMPL